MSPIPAAYQGYVTSASKDLGIPESVIAAQIALESSWNPNAVSGAGAEGIAQFMPGTFKEYGSGSPFNVADAFEAYVAYMKALLKQEGGDVRKALEAYNAGPGNLAGGAGYASTILTRAGVGGYAADAGTGDTTAATPATKSSGGGLLDWPGEITGWFSARAKESAKAFSLAEAIFTPTTYVRTGSGLVGIVFLIMGIIGLVIASRKQA
jgi:membrane-bound lytic murein transglycosylase B